MISRSNALKTPNNLDSNKFQTKYMDYFNPLNKSNNNFRDIASLSNQKKYLAHQPNLYRSFMKSSTPYNFNKKTVYKNAFLGPYNDGLQNQINPYMPKRDLNQNINENNQIIYKNKKPSYYENSKSLPQLSRNANYQNYRYNNNLNNSNNWDYRFNRTNYFQEKPSFVNQQGFKSSKSFRISNDGKIIYTLKKMIENKDNLRYKDNKSYNYKKCRFINSCFSFRPRTKNRFHKTQIFNLCKPYLTDEFQEFPEDK